MSAQAREQNGRVLVSVGARQMGQLPWLPDPDLNFGFEVMTALVSI
jgi:hypothetical protein